MKKVLIFFLWSVSALGTDGTITMEPKSGVYWPVTGTFWQTTQPVSFSSPISLASGSNAVGSITNTSFACTQSTGSNLHVVVDTAPTTTVTGSFYQATQPVSGTFWQTTQPVSIASLPALTTGSAVIGHVVVDTAPSTAVTNTGTFATQSTLSAETTKIIGTVNIASAQTVGLVAGSAVVGHVINDASSAVIGHVIVDTAPSTAVTNAGTFATQSTLSAETTKVIGTVNISSAQTVGIVAGSAVIGHVINDASSAVIGHVIADSGSTTAVTGNVAVTMAASSISGSNPCVNPTSTLVSIAGATSGTAAVQIIALSGSTKVYICSMSIIGVSGTTPTFSLVQGTGSNCASSQTVLKQSWATAAGTLYAFANPVAVGVAGQAVCYLDTGTTPIQNYQITYVQQ